MDDTMNIFAIKGYEVIYTGKNGYDLDLEHANEYLEIGEKYTIDYTVVGGSHTSVYLIEVPNTSFNSVHFKEVNEQPIELTKSHSHYKLYN